MTVMIHTPSDYRPIDAYKGQQTSHEVAEAIIAHQTASITERAYSHTDFLEQRGPLIEAREQYLTG